jgi:hypothetical protein
VGFHRWRRVFKRSAGWALKASKETSPAGPFGGR